MRLGRRKILTDWTGTWKGQVSLSRKYAQQFLPSDLRMLGTNLAPVAGEANFPINSSSLRLRNLLLAIFD